MAPSEQGTPPPELTPTSSPLALCADARPDWPVILGGGASGGGATLGGRQGLRVGPTAWVPGSC